MTFDNDLVQVPANSPNDISHLRRSTSSNYSRQQMNVVLFTWNPDKWDISDRTWARQARQIRDCGFLYDQWSTGNTTSLIQPGDVAFLLRQTRDRGIVAGGTVSGTVFQDQSWDDEAEEDRVDNYVEITWSSQLPIESRLPIETLKLKLPDVSWTRQASGTTVEKRFHGDLLALWRQHLASIGMPDDDFPKLRRHSSGSLSKPRPDSATLTTQMGCCAVCGVDSKVMYQVEPIEFLVAVDFPGQDSPSAVCPNCADVVSKVHSSTTLDQLRRQLHTTY